MPHKHKRKRSGDDAEFNLPPTVTARPLPVGEKQQDKPKGSRTKKRRRESISKFDDAPRGFRRIMALVNGKKAKSGLDDGHGSGSSRETPRTPQELPRIRPGEDLRTFAARVDSSLPISGLTKKLVTKEGKDILGLKTHRTQKERKMHKLYEQWRLEERKIQEQREEDLELIAERDLENDAAGILNSIAFADEGTEKTAGKRRRQQKSHMCNAEDPWLELKRRRAETKTKLNDVALAPPVLHKKVKNLLTSRQAPVDINNTANLTSGLSYIQSPYTRGSRA